MTDLPSLPSELLHEIIQTCSKRRLQLRATCRILKEHADPIVFRRIVLDHNDKRPEVTEHQIIALATRSSKACEFAREMEIGYLPDKVPASEQSWPHFGNCDDLRVHLPTVISKLKNLTSFSWMVFHNDPIWQINSLMQAVSRLPHLTKLDIDTWEDAPKARIPLGLFSNLSKLSVECGPGDTEFFISQMSTVIANSPQLERLVVTYASWSHIRPTLSELFAKVSTQNPMRLEHLSISYMDATVDQVVLPHLTHLTSFQFRLRSEDFSIARSVWTSFLVNGIKLSYVDIEGSITEETMLYLSSFSGLESLNIGSFEAPAEITMENVENMLYTEVLLKHVNSLQTRLVRGVNSRDDRWIFDESTLTSIMKCVELGDLCVYIDESFMPAQLLLDAVAHLPVIEILQIIMLDPGAGEEWLADFKRTKRLQYVEKLTINHRLYVLKKDGYRPARAEHR